MVAIKSGGSNDAAGVGGSGNSADEGEPANTTRRPVKPTRRNANNESERASVRERVRERERGRNTHEDANIHHGTPRHTELYDDSIFQTHEAKRIKGQTSEDGNEGETEEPGEK